MNITSQIKRSFFELYIVKELTKSEIKSQLALTEGAYVSLVKLAKKWDKQEITTDMLESIVVRNLLVNPDDAQTLKAAMELWKYKYKVPQVEKEEKIDGGVFSTEAPVHS